MPEVSDTIQSTMHGTGLFTVVVVFTFVMASVYRIQSLHRKKVWHLSFQQLIHLVLIPGILFPMIFSYLQTMTRLPKNHAIFVPDGFLVDTVLLSMLFTYGGVAIHAVTKMMSEYLSETDTEAAEINKFFHMTFSHNLTFGGMVVASLGLTLLELNHTPLQTPQSIYGGLWRGLLLGGSFFFAVFNYTRYTGGDYGKWSDLKATFGIVWVAFAVLLYVIQRFDPRFSEYQLLLPMLLSFSIMAVLSLILVFRRLKRGRWQVDVEQKRLKRYFSLEERD